jgi:uracil-DNA glycosylase
MRLKRTASSGKPRAPTLRAKTKQAKAPCTDKVGVITGSAADFMPPNPTIPKMRAAANGCRGCALYMCSTHAVFSDGPLKARVMIVGEQPGDVEDKLGKTFVGPAGKLLDKVFDEVGLDRSELYLTNAVKHFKWTRATSNVERKRGDEGAATVGRRTVNKKRIHKTPSAGEVRACFPWLEAEMKLLQPEIIVCLGATAAKAILGNSFSVMKSRGVPQKSPWAPLVIATVHPSSVLRAPSDQRVQSRADFVDDLREVAKAVHSRTPALPHSRTLTSAGNPPRKSPGYLSSPKLATPPTPPSKWRPRKRTSPAR